MNKKLLAVFTLVLVLAVFAALPATAVLATRGDANMDNEIDMKDVLVVRKVVANLTISHDPIAADANADDSIDMRDVLLLRKNVAGDVTAILAPYPSESSTSETSTVVTTTTTKAPTTTTTTAAPVVTTTTNGGGSGDEVTLSLTFLQQEKYAENDVTISKEWTYNRGETATIEAQVQLYKNAGLSESEVLGYFNWSTNNLTYVSFVEGPIISNNTTYTVTYTILMDSDKTVTGDSNGNKEKKYFFNANGAGGTAGTSTTTPNVPTTTTTHQVTPSTTRTHSGEITDPCDVQLSVSYPLDQYHNGTRTDVWEVQRNTTITFEIFVERVYHGTQLTDADVQAYVALAIGGTPLSYTYSWGPTYDNNNDLTVTGTTYISGDTTITGSVKKSFIMRVNGEIGVGGLTGTYMDALVCNSNDLKYDQVYLSYYDPECTTYGVSWHTYQESPMPVIQYVEGVATGDASFASAQTKAARITLTDNSSSVCMDYDPANNWSFTLGNVVSGIPEYTHKVELTGLKSNTTYSYRVGDSLKGTYGQIYSFTTRNFTDNSSAFTFGFMSDTQWAESTPNVSQLFKTSILDSMFTNASATPAFILHGGDMVDTTQNIHFWGALWGSNSQNYFGKYPLFGCTGNHDNATTIVNHFDYESPNAYYSFDYHNCHFIVLNDGSSDISSGDAQYNWLVSDLATANTKNYDWIIVDMHKPVYAPKQYNQNKGTFSEDGYKERPLYSPVFKNGNVDIVLQAHTHQYSRTYPMIATDTPQLDVTTSIENGTTYYENANGPIYTIVSCASNKGDPTIASHGSTDTENAYIAYSQGDIDGCYALLNITSNKITFNSYSDGQLFDSFGIKK